MPLTRRQVLTSHVRRCRADILEPIAPDWPVIDEASSGGGHVQLPQAAVIGMICTWQNGQTPAHHAAADSRIRRPNRIDWAIMDSESMNAAALTTDILSA